MVDKKTFDYSPMNFPQQPKKFIGWAWSQWKRILQHAPIGIIAPLLALVEPHGVVFGVSLLFLALAYQFIQEYQSNNGKSHIDVAGIVAGLPVGVLFLWLIQNI